MKIKACACVLAIIVLLSACNSSKTSAPQIESGGAPPASEFSTAEELIQNIKAVKEAGPEKMPHPDDYNLYNKDYVCLLKELPILDLEQTAIMLVSQGTVTYYENEKHNAIFYWYQGYEQTEELTERYSLEQYEDTKYHFGKDENDIHIFWWENGDQFELLYPTDTNIPPEEIVGNLVVNRYDF